MHVLVVNDDGPPSQVSSPYIHSFVTELRSIGATVSVVLPHTQRSWIAKAHLVGKTVTPTYFRPGTLHADDGTTHDRPRPDGDDGDEWVLVDGTPASCAQIGIHHYFQEKGPIDLVVSGPNYGRNSTALFALSSGTIGGAMEAAVNGKRAVALSYAFFNRNHDPAIIAGASLAAVRVIKFLHENWKEGVDLYSVNVPLLEGIEGPDTKILYTYMLQNYWASGSSFEPVDVDDELSPEESEAVIREKGEQGRDVDGENKPKKGLRHRKFKWAPKFHDVYASVEASEPGNDGWAVAKGHISITPLKANFMHGGADLIGKEVHLGTREGESNALVVDTEKLSLTEGPDVYALVDYEDAYVEPKVTAALRKYIPSIKILKDANSHLPKDVKVLNWSAYEKIPFDEIMERPETTLCCSYIIRKALIRKHHLALTVRHYLAKNPDALLGFTFPLTCDFELDFAEFLDEALMEAYEVASSLAANEENGKPASEREWWILKPGMSDRGQGIRLFSTTQELTEIFESFDGDTDDDEERDEEVKGDTSVVTSQLRHFVAQKYIHPPLLINNRKWHIRAYVLAVGSLEVYVYKPMLALFAAKEYSPPWESAQDLSAHLTNTCLQSGEREGSVRAFWELAELQPSHAKGIWDKIRNTVAEVFEGAARGQRVHFQTLPNAFELFGVDFVVNESVGISLLEVNAYPDFKQTGNDLGAVIEGLFEEAVKIAVVPFFGVGAEVHEEENGRMVKVLDIDLGSF